MRSAARRPPKPVTLFGATHAAAIANTPTRPGRAAGSARLGRVRRLRVLLLVFAGGVGRGLRRRRVLPAGAFEQRQRVADGDGEVGVRDLDEDGEVDADDAAR